jgi:tripartite-type tricarboxylate transporter receptor subunit TctC
VSGWLGGSLMRAALVLPACVCGVAHAQAVPGQPGAYPVKPIRLLVGNAPGGGIDITARAVGQKLTERWGRSVVVDNRPGASGIIAMDVVAQATPDGYTLLVISGSLIASAGVQKKVAFDVRKAYAPITQLTTVAYMLMVTASLPVNTVKDLIAYAKAKPNALSYGSSGIGGAGHLAGELFCYMAGVKIVHVPYKGGGLVLADMIGGQIQLGFTATISGMPHVRSGKLKALGVTSLRRAQAFPEVPTIAEAGVPGFELVNWYGIFAPAATPPAIVAALHREIAQSLNSAEVQSAFAKEGAEATPSASPEDFRALLAKEVANWEKLVRLPGFAEALR